MMRISTKGRYAVRIMQDLALHADQGPVSLRDIAERQNITQKYMESIMAILLRKKLVASLRGKMGGYSLVRKPAEYSVYEILCAAEGDMEPVQCLAMPENTCVLKDHCVTLPLWKGLSAIIRGYLEAHTLEELIREGADTIGCCHDN